MSSKVTMVLIFRMSAFGGLQLHSKHDFCSFSEPALDDTRAPDGCQPAGHIFEAVSRGVTIGARGVGFIFFLGIKAVAIVLDHQFKRLFPEDEPDGGFRGAGMFNHIVQSFFAGQK